MAVKKKAATKQESTVEDVASAALELLPKGSSWPGCHLADLAIYHVYRKEFAQAEAALDQITAKEEEREIADLAHAAAYLARAGEIDAAARHLERAKEWRKKRGEIFPDTDVCIEIWIRAASTLVSKKDELATIDLSEVAKDLRSMDRLVAELATALALCGERERARETMIRSANFDWMASSEFFQLLLEDRDFDSVDAVVRKVDVGIGQPFLVEYIVRASVESGQLQRGWQSLEVLDVGMRCRDKILAALFESEGAEGVRRLLEPRYKEAVETGLARGPIDGIGYMKFAGEILGVWSKYDPESVKSRSLELLSMENVDTVYGIRTDVEGVAWALIRCGAFDALASLVEKDPHGDHLYVILEALDSDQPVWKKAYDALRTPGKASSGWGRFFSALRNKPEALANAKKAFSDYADQYVKSRDNELFYRTVAFVKAMADIDDWATVDEFRKKMGKGKRLWLSSHLARRAFATGQISTGLAILKEAKDGFSSGDRQYELLWALLNIFSQVGERASG